MILGDPTGAFLVSLRDPLERKFLPGVSAFCKIQIDQILVRNTCFRCQSFKVGDSICVDAQSHLLLKVLCVRISHRI